MNTAVEVRIKFDRLAQAVRGVFLLRAADGDPHQVRIEDAELRPSGGGPSQAAPFESLVVDVQPGRDLVIPFDIRHGQVPRGAYTLRARVTIDGTFAEDVRAEVRLR